MNVPAYHIGVLKGYLSGQGAPAEIFVAAEALYMAAIQGPLRADAIEAINLVAQAAEKLMASSKQGPVALAAPVERPAPNPPKDEGQSEIVLPAITRRALEMASEATEPSGQKGGFADELAKVDDFIRTRGVTDCPTTTASGGDHEAIVGGGQPKKQRTWSPEARAAAAERMKARIEAGKMIRKGKIPDAGEAQAPSMGGA